MPGQSYIDIKQKRILSDTPLPKGAMGTPIQTHIGHKFLKPVYVRWELHLYSCPLLPVIYLSQRGACPQLPVALLSQQERLVIWVDRQTINSWLRGEVLLPTPESFPYAVLVSPSSPHPYSLFLTFLWVLWPGSQWLPFALLACTWSTNRRERCYMDIFGQASISYSNKDKALATNP